MFVLKPSVIKIGFFGRKNLQKKIIITFLQKNDKLDEIKKPQ